MRYTRALLLSLISLSALHATNASGEPLTVERIFAAPDLSGPRLREPKFSPDGRYVTYLQGKPDNKDQLDLWTFDTRTGQAKLLVDSRALIGDQERLSAEEEVSPRASANRLAARHRGVRIRGRRQAPAHSAGRRSVSVRSHGEVESSQPADDDRVLRNRCAFLPARLVRELHPRPGSLRDRAAHAQGNRADDRWRRPRAERGRRVRRPGGNGSQHWLLVVAG